MPQPSSSGCVHGKALTTLCVLRFSTVLLIVQHQMRSIHGFLALGVIVKLGAKSAEGVALV